MKGAEPSGTGDRASIHPEAACVCTLCACLCHDVNPLADAAELPACRIVRDFRRRIDEQESLAPELVEGRIAEAGKLFVEAVRYGRSIALVGLENAAWEVQKAAIDLAETAGAWVVRESEFPGVTSGWQVSFAQKGLRSATWTEIRQRSDALLLWYAPLWLTHPRWIERFGPRSPRAHRLAVISPEAPAPPEGWIEDQLVRVDPARAIEFLRAVRAALHDAHAEASDEAVRRIVHVIRNAHWLGIVRGEEQADLTDSCGVAETFTDLITEAECEGARRVVLTHVPKPIGSTGLDAILSMRAGLSTPMRFTPEGPMRGLGEWSPAHAECVMAFGPASAEVRIMNTNASRFVAEPGLATSHSRASHGHGVSIPAGWLGADRSGTVVRADGVVVPVRGFGGGRSIDLAAFLRALRQDVRRSVEQIPDEPEAGR